MLISASDPVGAALHDALDGLAMRQRVAANDIANMDTPGFTASTVDFESSLRNAIDTGTVTDGPIQPTTELSTAQAGANGNNVDLASETMTAMQATFQYQLLTRAVGDRYGLITTAIGGM
jgi:flagellar basal-body rod protein FlgB